MTKDVKVFTEKALDSYNGLLHLLPFKGVRHINGDLYHMLVEEAHIGETIDSFEYFIERENEVLNL